MEAPQGGSTAAPLSALGVIGRVHAHRGGKMADDRVQAAVERHLFSALILATFLARFWLDFVRFWRPKWPKGASEGAKSAPKIDKNSEPEARYVLGPPLEGQNDQAS